MLAECSSISCCLRQGDVASHFGSIPGNVGQVVWLAPHDVMLVPGLLIRGLKISTPNRQEPPLACSTVGAET